MLWKRPGKSINVKWINVTRNSNRNSNQIYEKWFEKVLENFETFRQKRFKWWSKITFDQLYDYFKSLNENNNEDDTDSMNFDEMLNNIENRFIIDILDKDISEEGYK